MGTEYAATAEDIESCRSLFLLEITEPEENSLLIVVGESSLGEREDAVIPGADLVLRDVAPIRHTQGDRVFAISWDKYIGYAVMNESFALRDDTEGRAGRLFVRFEESRFSSYMGVSTWWDDMFSGGLPRCHWEVNCENHSIDVYSASAPKITIRSKANP